MLNEQTFVQYALKAYDNHLCCTIEEFNDDVQKFVNLKRSIRREDITDEHVRRTLNYIVGIKNVFLYPYCVYMMFYRIHKDDWHKLKTYLVYLNIMPDEIQDLNIKSSDIPICQKIANILRTL